MAEFEGQGQVQVEEQAAVPEGLNQRKGGMKKKAQFGEGEVEEEESEEVGGVGLGVESLSVPFSSKLCVLLLFPFRAI